MAFGGEYRGELHHDLLFPKGTWGNPGQREAADDVMAYRRPISNRQFIGGFTRLFNSRLHTRHA